MKKIVLITGVNGGIGSATAKLFAKKGWYVIGIDNRKVELPTWIHHFIKADVSDMKAWKEISAKVTKMKGHIDALVNNAAIQICKPLIETTPEEWDTVMATNLRSVYLSIYYLHSLMRNYGGSIVNVSSVHAVATSANIAAYAASKGGLLALTRALSIELAPYKIRVNAILPGAVDTTMLHAGLNRGHIIDKRVSQQIENLGKKHVIGRIGRPEEIAQGILFLADSERSSFMTGQALIIDGGATVKLSTE
ncbi:MAG: short-chain dehydrogenase [Nitrospirae bacterium RBG_13_39_12]|nr:MAG: short-chain dehydrogenase [Nitrospirae bacterium RBG_13_39_12]